MAAIYAQSYVTIVAAQGSNDEAGLHGVHTTARLEHQFESRDRNQAVRRSAWLLIGTPWFSRGWTFQENLFARRKLVFHHDTVDWDCHCISWHEEQGIVRPTDQKPCEGSPLIAISSLSSTPWPDMNRFAMLVSLYSLRYFTFPEDVLDAFAGTLLELSVTFSGGFISGLPQMCFESVLIWQPFTPVERRRGLNKKAEMSVLPSWSWIGWQGNFHAESWSAYSYMRRNMEEMVYDGSDEWQPCSWVTTSTLRWCYSEKLGSTRTTIPSSSRDKHASNRLNYHDSGNGWTRYWCEETRRHFFRHRCDPGQEFWYPVPIVGADSERLLPVRARFLHCRTRTAHLRLGLKLPDNIASRCVSEYLMDGRDEVGVLRLNSLAMGIEADGMEGTLCELIELSAGSVKNQTTENVSFEEWGLSVFSKPGEIYEFYNVMWIEWVEGIAYRKAVGRVEKTAWERLATEAIEVTLG